MSEWWDPVEVKEKRKEKRKKNSASGVRNAASSTLGLISIISASISLIITISFIPNFNDSGGGWGLGFIFFVVPLMIFSFAMSSIGVLIGGSRTRAGTRLFTIALILTFSPILMIIIIGWIQEK